MDVYQKELRVTAGGNDKIVVEADVILEECLDEFGEDAFLEAIGAERCKEYFNLEDK